METIPTSALRVLFNAVYEMNAALDHADLMASVVAGMARLIPSDVCIVHVLDRRNGRIISTMHPENPFTEAEMAFYSSHPHENPMVAHYQRTGEQCARRTSDLISLSAWRKTTFYQTALARLRHDRTLAIPVTVDTNTVAALSFNRAGRDFTQQHCSLLDAFGPHFRQAWNRHPDSRSRQSLPGQETNARERLRQLGLTAREAEVLYWMTEGKQNREIALILDVSLQTVQKHVAHILGRLHQENRHAATVHALRILHGAASAP